MRIKSLATTAAAATLFLGLLAGPAAAGTGGSQACTDPYRYQSAGIDNPVTLAVEVQFDPLASPTHQAIWVCYSTTAAGQPNSLIGGALVLDVNLATDTTYPGAGVNLVCLPDSGVSVGPIVCSYANNANVAPFDVTTVPAGGTCLAALNGACLFFVQGQAVYTDRTPYPLVNVTVANVGVPVNLPAQCIGILTTC